MFFHSSNQSQIKSGGKVNAASAHPWWVRVHLWLNLGYRQEWSVQEFFAHHSQLPFDPTAVNG